MEVENLHVCRGPWSSTGPCHVTGMQSIPYRPRRELSSGGRGGQPDTPNLGIMVFIFTTPPGPTPADLSTNKNLLGRRGQDGVKISENI